MKGDISLLEVAGALTLAGIASLLLDFLVFSYFNGRSVWTVATYGVLTFVLIIANQTRRRRRDRL
jgi:hypothetical protein